MERDKKKSPGFWVSAAGLAALAAVFMLWCASGPELGAAGFAAAFASAALFALLCLRFVPGWMRFWSAAELPPPPPAGDEPRHIRLKIFCAFLGADALAVLLVFLLRALLGYGESFAASLEFWICTDSAHYLDIARDWYLSEGSVDRLVQLVFLPGYPLAVRLVNYIVGNFLYSGFIVSFLSFGGAGCAIYSLLRLDYTHEEVIRALKYLLLLPAAFFFAAPMSESFFLLLTALCVYCARKDRWLCGGLLGALAAFTRSLGLVLFVPLFFELVREAVNARGRISARRLTARFFTLLLIPAGFAAYCYINYLVSGDPFKFMQYQNEHWSQQLGWFFNTAGYQLEHALSCAGADSEKLFGLWLPNLLACFGSLAVMAAAAKKLRPSYTAWFIAYFAIATGTTWLLSAPRYLAALFPLPLALSALAKKPAADRLVSALSAALYLLYLLAFTARWQVW